MTKIIRYLIPIGLVIALVWGPSGPSARAADSGWTIIAGCEAASAEAIVASINTAVTQTRSGAAEVWRVHSVCQRGEWAYAYVKGYAAASGLPLPENSNVALAHFEGKAWTTALPEQPTLYNRWLKALPEDLIPTAARGMLAQPTLRAPTRTAQFSGYTLPYPAGDTAYAHQHWYPAVDFDILGPSAVGKVRNAKGGTAVFVKESSATECGDPPPDYVCWLYANTLVIQTGANEYAWYMHFAQDSVPNWIQEGVYVPAGATLGTEGSTGWASGPHVHFQVASTYWCCQGEGDTRMPDWPYETMYTVDFNEYAWWQMPAWAVSQNGADVDMGEHASPTQAAAPPETASAPPAVTPAPITVVAPPQVNNCPNPYTIIAGDWLYRIADRCGVTLQGIVAANPGLNPNWIKAGNKLNLPLPANNAPPAPPVILDITDPQPPPAATPAPVASADTGASALRAGCGGTYTVLPGDTLFRIALPCGLSAEYLAALNGIGYPYVIYPGQTLRYP